MATILGLVYLVLCILAIIDCVKSSKDTGKKVLWILFILIVPYIGVIVYFLAGREKKAAASAPPETPQAAPQKPAETPTEESSKES